MLENTENIWNWTYCSKCKKEMDIIVEKKIINYTIQKYGTVICYSCQQYL